LIWRSGGHHPRTLKFTPEIMGVVPRSGPPLHKFPENRAQFARGAAFFEATPHACREFPRTGAPPRRRPG
jgi:hypothetical protein